VKPLKIESIEIVNVGCIGRLTIKPDVLTIIEGRNATGKTTILNALRSVTEPGHDPSLLRKGAEEGGVKITLTDGITITETITPDKTTRVVRHPKMGKISRAKEWIESVINCVSFDPARFLTAKPAERVGIFLEALPIKLTADQLKFLPVDLVKEFDLDEHALVVIGDKTGGLCGSIFSRRTELNREVKDKKSTVAEMRKTLPETDGLDHKHELAELDKQLATLQRGTRAQIKDAETETLNVEHAEDSKLAEKKQQLNAELTKKIRQLEDDTRIELERCARDRDKVVAAAAENEKRRSKEIRNAYDPEFGRISVARGNALSLIEQEAKAQATRDLISKFETETEKREKEAAELTRQLNELERLKVSLLSDLPVKGLEIQDGQLVLDGIPFERVNDSEKHRVAVEVLRLNRGELAIQVLDRAEIFDSDSWESFKKACCSAGVPIIAARVRDTDLTVTTESVS